MNYGAYPPKLVKYLKCNLEAAEEIWRRYHHELYADISKMRDIVLDIAINRGRINLGLGCYMNTSNPEAEIRTLFNALTNTNSKYLELCA